MNKQQAYWINLLLIAVLSFTACPGGPNDPGNPGSQSNAKAITAFSINGVAGIINENAKTITITLPYDTSVSSLMPVINVSPGASVYPASGDSVDFSSSQTDTVTAEDGSTAQYTVTVTLTSDTQQDGKAITAFSINDVAGIINENAKTIAITLPYDTSVSSLMPVINVSPGASVYPASGDSVDFSSSQTYTVTAEDGSTAQYTVTVTLAPDTRRDGKAITAFSINDVAAAIDEAAKTITLTIPADLGSSFVYGTTAITVSEGARVSPDSGESGYFSHDTPYYYTVTAENDTWVRYTLRVHVAEKRILSFSLVNGGTKYTARVLEIFQYGGIYLSDQFPWDFDSPYITEITVSPGATISPASGEPLNLDENNSTVFTVTGADGSTFDYELSSLRFTHGGVSLTILTTSIDFSDDIHVTTSGTAIIADADYTGYQWWIDGRDAAGSTVSDGGRRLELAGLADGTYTVKVMAWKDGAPWMTDIEIVKGGN
jgi:hypothetical protein